MSDTVKNELPGTELRTSDFDYALPEELIAQHPAEPRDSSRLMVLDRSAGTLTHSVFSELPSFLKPGDTLVVNDSKVIPARLYGHPAGRPDAQVELLLLRQRGGNVWETLVRPGKRARIGAELVFGSGMMTAVVTDITDGGNRLVRLDYDASAFAGVYDMLSRVGTVPLPPYITEKLKDPGRYQTVYARREGSAAAPTAGLHFTPELLSRIREAGIAVVPVMLHVGLGTFRPVKEERIDRHVMHTEFFSVSKEAADVINSRRAAGGRTVCVGTTSCRTLESAAGADGLVRPAEGETGIFIYPGYRFRATDALITNFHLPKSTLLMLVSAFYSREKMLEAYRTAVEERYRFFSFGDAMFIV
jgi:S-adenosylmethionine:tRNA ribosyltransferase-isomerase